MLYEVITLCIGRPRRPGGSTRRAERGEEEPTAMKIARFQAPDMRQALRKVRDSQGPDAVILST